MCVARRLRHTITLSRASVLRGSLQPIPNLRLWVSFLLNTHTVLDHCFGLCHHMRSRGTAFNVTGTACARLIGGRVQFLYAGLLLSAEVQRTSQITVLLLAPATAAVSIYFVGIFFTLFPISIPSDCCPDSAFAVREYAVSLSSSVTTYSIVIFCVVCACVRRRFHPFHAWIVMPRSAAVSDMC